jgi:hypothetical protein
MLLAYPALILFLSVLAWVLRRRAASLERRYVRVAAEADALAKETNTKPGNSNKLDPLLTAKQNYQLAHLALKRDSVERRYTTWQSIAEKFAAMQKAVIDYRGKVLPYTLGALDVIGVAFLSQSLGVTLQDVRSLLGI